MSQADKSTGAETVRWNLSDLFLSPEDSRIEQTLAREMEHARAFEAKYKGKVATLESKAFAAMMRELEDYEKSSAKPEVYAYMLHSENTRTPQRAACPRGCATPGRSAAATWCSSCSNSRSSPMSTGQRSSWI